MWTPYLAEDLTRGRQVVLKVRESPLASPVEERFLRELARLALLDHPHILSVLDCGHAGQFLYFAVLYVQGESLRQRLVREKQLPLAEALRITCQVADALDYTHSHDLVHQDVKPESIQLVAGNAYLSDFDGMARIAARDETGAESGLVIGTAAYMSPELCRGAAIDGRSDDYALGCVLYEMLVGTPPFTASNPAGLFEQHLTQEPPSLRPRRREVTAAVEACVMKALSKDPTYRHQTSGALAQELRDSAAALSESVVPLLTKGPKWWRFW